MLDDDFGLDLDELRRVIDSSEVFCLYFPMLRKTLVLDSRSNGTVGPFATLQPMVANAEERMQELRRLRPGFPAPDSLVLAPWPKRVRTLRETGIMDLLTERFERLGAPEAASTIRGAIDELLAAEEADLRDAIRGENYRTVWERSQ